MADRRSQSDAPVPEFIQARRVEIIDDLGTPSVVLGDLSRETDYDYWPGLAIRDAYGRTRGWLMLHADGIDLELDLDGNTVAVLGVSDHHTPAPGTRLTLCKNDGAPILDWYVSIDGTTEITSPEA